MVMAIIGAVFAFIQVCVAAGGASYVRYLFSRRLDGDCEFCKKVFATDLRRETEKDTGACLL